MSDIHGDIATFDKILSMIDLNDRDYLYILGDVIDRGPDGIELLRKIRKIQGCQLLLGNHELMMINALRRPMDRESMRLWLRNRCEPTVDSFKKLLPDEQEDILQYLESLSVQVYLSVQESRYILVHAAPVELYEQGAHRYFDPIKFAVWHRFYPSAKMPENKIVIHGHTPTINDGSPGRMMHFDQRINIDCGNAYPELGGQLGCLRLEDMREFYSNG
jgi:serine/threonine protein phosphatase 1